MKMKTYYILLFMLTDIYCETLFKFNIDPPKLYNITSKSQRGIMLTLKKPEGDLYVFSKVKLVANCYFFNHCINDYLIRTFETFNENEAKEWAEKKKCIIPKNFYGWNSAIIACSDANFRNEAEIVDPRQINDAEIKNNQFFGTTCNIFYGCSYEVVKIPIGIGMENGNPYAYIHYMNNLRLKNGPTLFNRISYSLYIDYTLDVTEEEVNVECLSDEENTRCSSNDVHFNKKHGGGCNGQKCIKLTQNVNTDEDSEVSGQDTIEALSFQELNFQNIISATNAEAENVYNFLIKMVEHEASNDPHYLNKIFDLPITTEFVDDTHFLIKKVNEEDSKQTKKPTFDMSGKKIEYITLDSNKDFSLYHFTEIHGTNAKVVDFNAKVRLEKTINDFYESSKGKYQGIDDIFATTGDLLRNAFYYMGHFALYIIIGIVCFVIVLYMLVKCVLICFKNYTKVPTSEQIELAIVKN